MVHGRLRRRGAVPGVAHRTIIGRGDRQAGRTREPERSSVGIGGGAPVSASGLERIQRLHGERAGALGAPLRHPKIEPRSAPLDQSP